MPKWVPFLTARTCAFSLRSVAIAQTSVVGEPEVDQSSQVDGGDTQSRAELVPLDAAESDSSVVVLSRARRWIVRPWVDIFGSPK